MHAYTPNLPVQNHDHMWRKPSRGTVKINVDASFCVETMTGATGAVARDDHWEFVVAAVWFMPHVICAESAEMATIRNELYLAGNIGCNSVVVESGS